VSTSERFPLSADCAPGKYLKEPESSSQLNIMHVIRTIF
jgi:hypothetical protein